MLSSTALVSVGLVCACVPLLGLVSHDRGFSARVGVDLSAVALQLLLREESAWPIRTTLRVSLRPLLMLASIQKACCRSKSTECTASRGQRLPFKRVACRPSCRRRSVQAVGPDQFPTSAARPAATEAPLPKVRRTDLPVVRPSSSGSLSKALASARPEAREATLDRFKRDIWAPSNQKPQQARWNTWSKVCAAWDIPATVKGENRYRAFVLPAVKGD